MSKPKLGQDTKEALSIAAAGRRIDLLKEQRVFDAERIINSPLFQGMGGPQEFLPTDERSTTTATEEPAQEAPAASELDTPIDCKPQGDRIAKDILRVLERNEPYFRQSWTQSFMSVLEVIEYAIDGKEEEYLKAGQAMRPEALTATREIMGHLMKMYFDYAIEDILGRVYMEIASRWKASGLGQFFTPDGLSEMLAMTTLGDIHENIARSKAEGRKITICDPCCGAGSMLLGAKRVIVRAAGLRGLDYFSFSGQDVDAVCVRMSRIQLSLTDYRFMADRMIVAAYQVSDLRSTENNS